MNSAWLGCGCAVVLAAGAAAQESTFRITKTDGAVVSGPLAALTETSLALTGPGTIGFGSILFFHGPGARLTEPGRVRLDLPASVSICGDVIAGDADGEAVTVRAASLGAVRIPIDWIHLLRVKQRGRFHGAGRFAAAPGDEDKEAVFRETALGLDPIAGVLESIRPDGIHFEWRENEDSDVFAWNRVAGLRLPAEVEPERGAVLELVVLTSDACRVRGAPRGLRGGKLVLVRGGFEWLVDVRKILAGHVVDPKTRVWLSDLTPKQVAERDFFAKQPLYPWRRNQNVLGTPLRVRERYWTTGIGCHSLSRLTYVVPAGCKRMMTWIGADDSALERGRVGDMAFKVSRGGKTVLERTSVKGGQAPIELGRSPIQAGDEILFEVGFGAGIHQLDRADWLAPVFLK